MGKAMYMGVNGVARKAKKVYVGVNGVARKVKKIYVGVNGVARLAWIGEVPAGQVIFTSSQVWTVPDGVSVVDVFLVGGGASGNGQYKTSTNEYNAGGIGGSSGYTATYLNVSVTPNSQIAVVVGAGGTASGAGIYGKAGGTSSFGSYVANGCAGGAPIYTIISTSWTGQGMNGGGSGGGVYGYSISGYYAGRQGGSDGANGQGDSRWAGKGQGTTTRAFGESTGTLYAGGGSGGGAGTTTVTAGGSGGGGAGGASGIDGTAGTPNTGGGGGGAGFYRTSGAGGSGIVIVRWKAQ